MDSKTENFFNGHLYRYQWYKQLSEDVRFYIRSTIKDAIEIAYKDGCRSGTFVKIKTPRKPRKKVSVAEVSVVQQPKPNSPELLGSGL